MDKELLNKATKAIEKAYSPYSNYSVGAAVRTEEGTVFDGCNIENASYGLSICAERVALFKAVSEGQENITEISIVIDDDILPSPCGACRQVISELAPDAKITLATKNGLYKETKIDKLLPNAFKLDNRKVKDEE
ncbi:MAG: cytidine deaminase [Clostridia bacterium]